MKTHPKTKKTISCFQQLNLNEFLLSKVLILNTKNCWNFYSKKTLIFLQIFFSFQMSLHALIFYVFHWAMSQNVSDGTEKQFEKFLSSKSFSKKWHVFDSVFSISSFRANHLLKDHPPNSNQKTKSLKKNKVF